MLFITKSAKGYKSLMGHNPNKDYFSKTTSESTVQKGYEIACLADANHKKQQLRPTNKGRMALADTGDDDPVCIDWYYTETTYDYWGNVIGYFENFLFTTCDDPNGNLGGGGDGGNGSDPSEDEEENQKDTDCESFTFKKTSTANWQEAGLNKVALRMVWSTLGNTPIVRLMEANHIVYGLPTYYTNADGTTTTVSAGQAANIAAEATEYARNLTYLEFRNSPTYPSEATIIAYFKEQVNLFMLGHRGTAGVNGSGSPAIIFNDEERSHWTDPTDC